jgi:hypothetical protein
MDWLLTKRVVHAARTSLFTVQKGICMSIKFDFTRSLDDPNWGFNLTSFLDDDDMCVSGVVPEGKYHVHVVDVSKEILGDKPAIRLVFAVLAGTMPNCRGREISEAVFLTEKAIPRAEMFAYRLGLIPPSCLGKCERVRVNWGRVLGRQAIVEVKIQEFYRPDGEIGERSKLTYDGIWTLDDPAVADVPRGVSKSYKAQVGAVASAGAAFDPYADL